VVNPDRLPRLGISLQQKSLIAGCIGRIELTRSFRAFYEKLHALKLSVVIPAYNRAILIPDTINSILSCGLDDFEIVVVDDGSTDRTPEVVRAMGGPVRYVRQSNGGLASARNAGLAASCGRYVAFLDSDD
jgi:cellulose synthase/poly-beta-1,6-N-acetylglucosamine synthase-like glycosyltransferase